MLRTILTIVLFAGAVGAVHAQGSVLKRLEHSYELSLTSLVLPMSTAGSVIVKPCDDCSSVTHRVTAATTYLLNGRPVPLDEFLITAEARRRVQDDDAITAVGVYVDIESERVTRILLSYADR